MGSTRHQLGIGLQNDYVTPAAPTVWPEILNESITLQQGRIESEGIRPGRRLRPAARSVVPTQWGAGAINMEVATSGMELILAQMLGDTAPGVAVDGAATEHTFRLGPMTDSLTIAKGVQRTDDPNEVEPFVAVGCMFTGWTMSISAGGFLQLSLEVNARDVLDADNDGEVLPVADYPDGVRVFHFAQGAIRVDGDAVADVYDASITTAFNLTTGRFPLGAQGRQSQPRNIFGDAFSGTLTADFSDPADLYNAYHDNTTLTVDLEFVGDVIEVGPPEVPERLTVSLGAVKLGGTTPTIGGTELAQVQVPFTAYEPEDGSDEILIEYVTATPPSSS